MIKYIQVRSHLILAGYWADDDDLEILRLKIYFENCAKSKGEEH